MTPRDTVLEGFRALVTEFPAMLARYGKQLEELDRQHAEKLAAHVTLDQKKAQVEADAEQYRRKLTEAIEADIAERAKARKSIDDGILTLQKDRQALLNDLAGLRAEREAVSVETVALRKRREEELASVNAQIEAATAKHKQILADIAQVVRQHGGVPA